MTKFNKPVVSAWIGDVKKREKLRIEAAKRGMTLSRYCGLLIEKATRNYVDFDVAGHDVTFKPKRENE